jgi:hypothetical protein
LGRFQERSVDHTSAEMIATTTTMPSCQSKHTRPAESGWEDFGEGGSKVAMRDGRMTHAPRRGSAVRGRWTGTASSRSRDALRIECRSASRIKQSRAGEGGSARTKAGLALAAQRALVALRAERIVRRCKQTRHEGNST